MSSEELTSLIRHVATRLVLDLENSQNDNLLVAAAMDRSLSELAATNVWGVQNRLPSGVLWEVAGEMLGRGALLHQARFKPRGYAGDYQMLARIVTDWRCEDPLGSAIDDYFQQHAAPQAVRNRTQYVATELAHEVERYESGEFHVVSVGSGPALDILQAIELLTPSKRSKLRITLLDLDPEALDDAAARLSQVVSVEQIDCRRENLFRLPQRLKSLATSPVDFVCCTGFFDYLNDQDAAKLLALFWNSLATFGRVIVFNFAPHNPSRALMEWLGNWYLIYRDQAAMAELATQASIPAADIRVGAETLEIDLYIDARRT